MIYSSLTVAKDVFTCEGVDEETEETMETTTWLFDKIGTNKPEDTQEMLAKEGSKVLAVQK